MPAPTLSQKSLGAIIAPFIGQTGGLIGALHAVQRELGYLPPETESVAAAEFNLTRAEVKGVISFYSDFHRAPKGRTHIRLCAAEACQAQGGRELEREIHRRFALAPGETSASGDLTLEHVYCLGLCSAGPAAMIDGDLMARATPEKIAAAFDARQRPRK
mgnify:CR=1 FL=1